MGWLAVALVAGLGGCTGEVDVWLVDLSAPSPDAELDVASFELPFHRVEARMGSGWVVLERGPNPYNLLDFSGDQSPVELADLRDTDARLAHDEISVGPVEELRLLLVPGEAMTFEDSQGGTHAVTLAEGAQEALTVPVSTAIVADGPASVTLALDVRASLTAAVGGGYTFAPVFTVVE